MLWFLYWPEGRQSSKMQLNSLGVVGGIPTVIRSARLSLLPALQLRAAF